MRSRRRHLQRPLTSDAIAACMHHGVLTLVLCTGIVFGACAPTTNGTRMSLPVATATPVAQGLTVFATSGAIFALRASDGKLRWQYTAPGNLRRPAVVDGVLYTAIPSSSGYFVVALNERDRSERWQTAVSHPVADAPTVVDGIVYVSLTALPSDSTPFGAVCALRTSDGLQRWCARTGDPLPWSPAVANGVVYVTSYSGTMYALRADRGTPLWRFQRPDLSAPVVAGDLVLTVAYQGALYALRTSDGHQVWRYGSSSNTGTFTLADGVVYMTGANSSVTALRLGDGSVVWQSRVTERLVFPLVADGLMLASAAGGDIVALHASNGSLLWRSAVGPDPTVSAVVGDTAYGYTTIPGMLDQYPTGDVFAISMHDGRLLWTYHMQTPPIGALTVAP